MAVTGENSTILKSNLVYFIFLILQILISAIFKRSINLNLLKPTALVMHQQV
jgi:hypothetical protein